MTPATGRAPRRDAQRNRERILEAAREVVAEHGVAAKMEQVATRAGVGIGTLYRHFATREALVEAILERRIGDVVAVAETAAAEPDGWTAFEQMVRRTLELQASDRVLKEIVLRYPPAPGRLASAREDLRALFEQVLDRARADGGLRADFTVSDLALLLWSFAPVMDATATVAPDAWRRHLHVLLDGLRADAATPHAEPPLSDDELQASMRALRESQRRR